MTRSQESEVKTNEAPYLLPQEIISPKRGTIRVLFARGIGYPLTSVKLWNEGQLLEKNQVPEGLRLAVEYLPAATTSPINALQISWPESMETWAVRKWKLLEQLELIMESKGKAKIDGNFLTEDGTVVTSWPKNGKVYWRVKERVRVGAKISRKGPPTEPRNHPVLPRIEEPMREVEQAEKDTAGTQPPASGKAGKGDCEREKNQMWR
jgi:hypothetical protein